MNNMKVKNLLVFFLKNTSKPLGRTEIMKYVYLFEYYYYQKYNEQYTDLTFERYKYGPNQTSVVEASVDLASEGVINISSYENYYGGKSYDHTIGFGVDVGNYELGDK